MVIYHYDFEYNGNFCNVYDVAIRMIENVAVYMWFVLSPVLKCNNNISIYAVYYRILLAMTIQNLEVQFHKWNSFSYWGWKLCQFAK